MVLYTTVTTIFIYLPMYLAVLGLKLWYVGSLNPDLWHMGSSSLIRDQTGPLRGECGVFATGSPGKSLPLSYFRTFPSL